MPAARDARRPPTCFHTPCSTRPAARPRKADFRFPSQAGSPAHPVRRCPGDRRRARASRGQRRQRSCSRWPRPWISDAGTRRAAVGGHAALSRPFRHASPALPDRRPQSTVDSRSARLPPLAPPPRRRLSPTAHAPTLAPRPHARKVLGRWWRHPRAARAPRGVADAPVMRTAAPASRSPGAPVILVLPLRFPRRPLRRAPRSVLVVTCHPLALGALRHSERWQRSRPSLWPGPRHGLRRRNGDVSSALDVDDVLLVFRCAVLYTTAAECRVDRPSTPINHTSYRISLVLPLAAKICFREPPVGRPLGTALTPCIRPNREDETRLPHPTDDVHDGAQVQYRHFLRDRANDSKEIRSSYTITRLPFSAPSASLLLVQLLSVRAAPTHQSAPDPGAELGVHAVLLPAHHNAVPTRHRSICRPAFSSPLPPRALEPCIQTQCAAISRLAPSGGSCAR